MFDKMSGDEVLAFIACCITGLVVWAMWYRDCVMVARLSIRKTSRWLLYCVPLVSAALLYWVLKNFSSHDVRDDPVYVRFYMAMGAAWLGLTKGLFSWSGLSARDDVLERGNQPAAYALSGAWVGLTLCFAGGNIGDGPGWWVVVFAAALSTAAFWILWIVMDRLTGLADVITIDRDDGAGVRAAGFFIGSGLALGRAVAGNWQSASSTVADFLKAAWPALALLSLAVAVERTMKPAVGRDPPSTVVSLIVALLYCGLGCLIVAWAGKW